VIVVSAPSGAGKSTVLGRVLREVAGLRFSVSHTTRKPRPGESDGVAYHFVDVAGFRRLRDTGRMLEWAEVHGNLYGTSLVEYERAEAEGLDRVFKEAGFEWREAGCSMCLGMNPDILSPGERCASTSNRNFEGRQGAGSRTHLVSPAMAAAAAIAGHFVDIREWR